MDQSNDMVRLIYLGILVVATASYFASDLRSRLNQTLQMIAVWTLIFMAAIAAYSFRDLIAGEVFTSTPRLADGGGVSVTRQADGHFYIVLLANDQDVEFVIDTGATDIVLSQTDAAKVGIDFSRLEFLGEASTANGLVKTAAARLDSLVAPGLTLNDVLVSVNGGELDMSLLGMSYLNRFTAIAIEGDKMTLTP